MAKLGYESMLLPGEELMYKIQGVYDISQQLSSIGTLYITSFQSFFVDEARGQLKDIIPHGCVSSLKKYKSQSTNNVPITDKLQYLEILCKDLRVFKYILPSSSRPAEVRRYLEHAALPDNFHDICAFAYAPQLAALDAGWNVYNPLDEYRRIGLVEEGGAWRVSEFNSNFATCPTYPEIFVVPSAISDKTLEKVAEFRSKARIPVCVWKHGTTSATISRCSQPLVGIGRRSEEDEAMLREIHQANKGGKGKTLYIVDARPKVNAAACTLSGGGTEIVGNYSDANASLEYCGIANIHVVRDSFKRLGKVCRDPRKSHKWSDVTHTHWLDHISSILTAACRMVTYVDTDGCSVLTHCTDGWDRTSQLCALAELLMDPYYRTIRGFVVLICKEFISFGHKFNTRNGQCAPIFVQFMDCVWQLTRQFPTSFEFSEHLLLLITTHLYTHLFGTFLCDNDCERASFSLHSQTSSLWGLILSPPPSLAPLLTNTMYAPHPGTLHGNGNVNSMQLWRAYYQGIEKDDKKEDSKGEDGKKEETNGLKSTGGSKVDEPLKSSGGARVGETQMEETTLLHEMILVPFLDKLTHAEKVALRQELAAWISVGDGKVREKMRVVITPRVAKGKEEHKGGEKGEEKEKEKEKGKFGTVRSASSKAANKGGSSMNVVHGGGSAASDDEGEWEEGDQNGERAIRRGRSFSTVFAKVTGRSKGGKKEDKAEDEKHDAHDGSPNSTTSRSSNDSHNKSPPGQSPSVRIIGSTSRKNIPKESPTTHINTETHVSS